jgi:hypothetical protein
LQIDLKKIENNIMNGLKDFQRATVKRVFELYQSGQNRVLVADEVGLGKTLIAKGVIAKTARNHHEYLHKEIFKVVYICSNQTIANQNINKLKVSDDVTVDGVSDTRLSMQHLKIFEQENDPKVRDGFIQLIPLTPATSFSQKSGSGSVMERALIFAILKRMPLFKDDVVELEQLLINGAYASWSWARDKYEERVKACDEITSNAYTTSILKSLDQYFEEHETHLEILSFCERIKAKGLSSLTGTYHFLNRLRMMFAQISVELLKPDLVIMDEFQRFKFLIASNETTETGLLADRFLKGNDIHILLLSATPYKLYSTLEEITETQSDEHYSEFFQVMNFLINHTEKQNEFKEIWSDFSIKLREMNEEHFSILEVKNKAEDAMYQSVCRTERISAIDSGDFIDDKSIKTPITVTEKDIISYIEAESLLNSIGQQASVPVDYVKSAPYLLSFMKNYQLKKNVEKYFHNNTDQITLAKKKHLWINDQLIRNYRELPSNNARLEKLKEEAFENNAELLLWVPPSKPYYEPQGVFKDAGHFSKILVFSAWEMVPRMISSLLSYEAERKTVGKLVAKNRDKKNTGYFVPNNKRFPVARLRFNVVNGTPNSMSMFCLLYPSKFLTELYKPIENLNVGKKLSEIERDIKTELEPLLNDLKRFQSPNNRVDERWYYLVPLLLDELEHVSGWFDHRADLLSGSMEEEEERGQKGFHIHLDKLKEYYQNPADMQLGRMPKDLTDVLVKMAIASPANCALRANGHNSAYATQIAKVLINQFNRPEATAVVELSYEKMIDEAHWKNVLSYCRDGNLQALFDEYFHILAESNGLMNSENKYERLQALLLDSVKTHSASYTVDTYQSFKNSMVKNKVKGVPLRSHYAVGFYKGEGDNSQVMNRKESIRNSFNSPFRPFVLATTSIGQEGLDFHYYCRKIMHWNLPSNPIDLEQREGRINRFKCLAIRQNLSIKYGSKITFDNDVWTELFDYAKEIYKGKYSELIPFWCLPDDQEIKIERIVPVYPMSKDIGAYRRLIKILSLYRLTLGQARQEELLEYLLENNQNSEKLSELFINLSPYYKEQKSFVLSE